MFYTPQEHGFPPVVNGRKTRILKFDEKIQNNDWLFLDFISFKESSRWRNINCLDSPRFPDGRIIIRLAEDK